jgi:hypothetical protein
MVRSAQPFEFAYGQPLSRDLPTYLLSALSVATAPFAEVQLPLPPDQLF